MTIGDPNEATLWEGQAEDLKNKSTGGKLAPKYRLTPWHLYVERGLVRTDSQQVQLVTVSDVDVKQTMTQKALGVGTVTVHHAGQLTVLESVRDPKTLRDLVNRAAGEARAATAAHHRSTVNVAPSAAAPGVDVADQLARLAALRDQGVLTEQEFSAQKARLLAG